MRQIKRGVFVKSATKKPPCARGRGGEGAAGGPGRCAAFAFIRRGGFHIRPGCLRRRGVRRDGGIPPYGRLGGGGRSFGPDIFGRFVGEGHAPPAGPCATVNIHGRAMALPYEPAQMLPPSGWPEAQNSFVGAGFIPPAGVCPSAGCAGRCKHRPLQGLLSRGAAVSRLAPAFAGRRLFAASRRARFIRSRRSRRSLRPGQGPRARGRGPGPGFRPP